VAYYGVIYPEFWTGPTGRALRVHGKDAQLLALYLLSAPHANMIGLYHLPLPYIRQESGLTVRSLTAGLAALEAENFARYDATSEFVWVREMARVRMNIGPGRPALDKKDLKAIGAQKLYATLPSNPWLGPFFDRYAKVLHLRSRREAPLPLGLRSPFQAPSKPVTESVSVSESDLKAPARSRRLRSLTGNRATHGLLCRLLGLVRAEHPDYGYADQAAALKDECGRLALAYHPDDITKALEACDESLRPGRSA